MSDDVMARPAARELPDQDAVRPDAIRLQPATPGTQRTTRSPFTSQRPRLFKLATPVLGDTSEAEDVVQEVTMTRGSVATMPEQNAATEHKVDERFARLVEPELDVLLRVAISLADQRADAEDLVQDTLLRAYRSMDSFDGRHPRAWLLTILRNARINSTRRRRPQLLDEPDAIERVRGGWPGSGSSAGAEQVVVDDMFDSAIAEAVRELPLGFRRVVHLVDVQGLSYADCAQLLGIPKGTVMSRLHRARKRVRARLAECGLGPQTVTGT